MRPTSVTSSILLASLLMTLTLFSSAVVGHDGSHHDHGDEATWPGDPYSVDLDLVGVIGCAAAYRPFSTIDLCGGPSVENIHVPTLNQNAQTRFRLDMDAGISGIAIRVESEAGPLGKHELMMMWQVPVNLIDPIAGPVPLHATQEFQPEDVATQQSYTHANDNPAGFQLRLNPDASQPQIGYDQKFHVYMTIFYNGEPIPDGYVPGPQ